MKRRAELAFVVGLLNWLQRRRPVRGAFDDALTLVRFNFQSRALERRKRHRKLAA